MIVMVIYMKVKLYFENEKAISKSGIGKALEHQKEALSLNGISYTTDHNAQDYDVLHINTTMLLGVNEIKNAQKLGKPVVYHAHSTMEDFKGSFLFSNAFAPFYKKWLIYLYSQADCIITPTPYSKSILEGYGIKQPIYAISNGIDVKSFAYDEQKVKQFRDYFHLAPSDRVVMSVGWLFERKGFDTFCEVAANFPWITFIWFGDKELSMPTPNILKIIETKPNNVILPGYISGDIIQGAYEGCDLFFFPSREETEGIVVLEALASKAPVLVRDIGVYDGWLEDGINCFKAHNNEEFCDYIQQFFDGQLPDLREAGYQTACQRGLAQIGSDLKNVYEKAIEMKEQHHESII